MITHLVSESGYRAAERRHGAVQGAIVAVKEIMRGMPQVTIEPTHTFAEGLYARGILIPKGTIITGKVHKQDDLQVMVYGDILVKTESGEKRLEGFNMFASKAGYQQIGRALEDTLWVTVHATNSTDLDELEQILFEDEPRVLDFKTGKPMDDCIDYHRMLAGVGISHATAWLQSINEADRRDISIPGVVVEPSPIHGLGVFAAQAYAAEDPIGMARIDGLRTQLGRYTNHSMNPNSRMVREGEDIALVALAEISKGMEITVDYRQSLALSGIKGAL